MTPGHDDSPSRLERLRLPNLRGRSVLDVGAWDGFFSFEAERRGAERVLATDHFCWSGPGWGTREGFDLARRALGSGVEDRDVDVLRLSPDEVGTFDVTLFLGVLYHLRDPLVALERVASVTGDTLVLETVVDLLDVSRPAMAFYPGRELDDDPTNWWAPNPPALMGMLGTVGFRQARIVSLHPPRRTLRQAVRRRPRRARVVMHARRGYGR